MKHSLIHSIILLGLAASPLFAQEANDDVAATAAALPAIMAKLPTGPTALVYNDQTVDLSRRLATRIGQKIEHESSKLVCRDDLRYHRKRCSLTDVASLVNLSGVTVRGDSATVYFALESRSNSAWQPVETDVYAVDLARSNGVWTVVNIKLVIL